MTLRFDEPAWFWGLIGIVAIVSSWWWLDRLPTMRRAITLLCRAGALAAILVALARPQLLSTQPSIAVVAVLDVSGSIDRFAETRPEAIAAALDGAARRKAPLDRFGVVAFDGRARALLIPTSAPRPPDTLDVAENDGTALADAVSLARALIPADEAGRVVVVSDGLETIGRAEDVASSDRAGRVPIDTVLVGLRNVRDVAIDGFDLPATALPRSVASALVTVRSTAPVEGVIRFRSDGRSLTLTGSGAARDGLPVSLAPGATTVRAQLPIGDGPVHELEVVFEPSDPASDAIPENSRAKRVVAVPAGRSVLALGSNGEASPADTLLVAAGFDVRRMPADALPEDPLWLAGFDLVLLDDVRAGELSTAAQSMIVDHVQRLGGGLLCTGGPTTFGPGGWRGSVVAELLPVEVEPPTELRRPKSAVVFVIDRSGSMRARVAGARATQQEVANEAAAMAIESIASRAFVGVIAFENHPTTIVPIAPLDDSKGAARRVREIQSDGGTAIGGALSAALDALEGIGDVDQKIVVLLTDGVGRDDDFLKAQAARAATMKANVTTIAIGDSADDALLEEVATTTGGVFHAVRNPRTLPRILIESVQSVNRPLIREGVIAIEPTGDSDLARALGTAPPLGGLVVLGRPRSSETMLDARTPENEPVLARWAAGVGRVAVFASDFGDSWTRDWSTWRGAGAFWEQTARWCARAPGSAPVAAEARIEDGRFVVSLEAAAADAVAGAVVEGMARTPGGERRTFTLHRVAPRRFVGSIDANESGPWLAVLSPRGEAGPLPPMLAAAVAPEGAEYERHDADPAPLDALREATGGRALPIESLATADLFSREGLRLGMSERALAPELLALAALLFVTDTALRRLAVRRRMIAEAVTVTNADAAAAAELAARRLRIDGASGRSTPRAKKVAAAAAYEDDGPGVEERGGGGTRGAAGRDASLRPTTARARPATPSAPPGPSEDDIRRALAALRREEVPAASKDEHEAAPPAPVDDDDSSTLDALRRARDRSRIFPP